VLNYWDRNEPKLPNREDDPWTNDFRRKQFNRQDYERYKGDSRTFLFNTVLDEHKRKEKKRKKNEIKEKRDSTKPKHLVEEKKGEKGAGHLF
jgi:hypothetical protein